VRDARAGGVQQAGGLLRPGPRRSDDPDPSRPDHVGEAESDATEHRRAAFRPHHQESAVRAATLELDFRLERHVIGKQEHVHSRGEGSMRFQHGVVARHRDDRHVGSIELPRRRGQ